MTVGDTFVFGGEILKYEALVEDEVYVSRSDATDRFYNVGTGVGTLMGSFVTAGIGRRIGIGPAPTKLS